MSNSEEKTGDLVEAAVGAHFEPVPRPSPSEKRERQLIPLIWPEEQHNRNTRVNWVVRNLIRQGAVGTIYGLPGTFKRFVILDAAICIANNHKEILGCSI